MGQFPDHLKPDVLKRDWNENNNTAINEQYGPGNKRQCVEHQYTGPGLLVPECDPGISNLIPESEQYQFEGIQLDNGSYGLEDEPHIINSGPINLFGSRSGIIDGQTETENWRQDLENGVTASTPFLSGLSRPNFGLTPTSQFEDCEMIDWPEDIWGGYQNEQDLSNHEQLKGFGLQNDTIQTLPFSDLVEQSKCFQVLESPQTEQHLQTPDSKCDYEAVQSETIAIPQDLSSNVASSQSWPEKPYDVCLGMVGHSYSK